MFKKDNLGISLTMEELDSSNGILFPVYDEDTGLIFLCGKVDNCNWDEEEKKMTFSFYSGWFNHSIFWIYTRSTIYSLYKYIFIIRSSTWYGRYAKTWNEYFNMWNSSVEFDRLSSDHCLIFSFYKLLNNGLCEVISFTVPRKV